jgi:hypothetical protein
MLGHRRFRFERRTVEQDIERQEPRQLGFDPRAPAALPIEVQVCAAVQPHVTLSETPIPRAQARSGEPSRAEVVVDVLDRQGFTAAGRGAGRQADMADGGSRQAIVDIPLPRRWPSSRWRRPARAS